jgi:hypothetical protein
VNNRSIPSTHTERKTTGLSGKHSFTPYPSLSPYRQMDGMTDGETSTLAVHGLEELRVNLLLKENSYVSYIILHQSLILDFFLCVCAFISRIFVQEFFL